MYFHSLIRKMFYAPKSITEGKSRKVQPETEISGAPNLRCSPRKTDLPLKLNKLDLSKDSNQTHHEPNSIVRKRENR